jgi:stage II sporulation protein D
MGRLVFLLFGISIIFAQGVKEALYKTALEYMQRANYIGALEILHFLGDYKDSPKLYQRITQFFTPPPTDAFKREPFVRIKIAQSFESVTLSCEDERNCTVTFNGKTSMKLPPQGKLELLRLKGEKVAILHLPLEIYLRGVLAGEVYPRWPMEALKAQAVASRTYALFNLYKARRRGLPYDMDATTNYQVFKISALNHSRLAQAVEETRGEVLTYKGGLIYAMFHSNSGGCTENFEEITGLALPYLTSVRDNCTDITLKWNHWDKKLSKERIRQFLKRELDTDVYQIEDLKIKRGTCGRGLLVTLETDKGNITLPLAVYFRLKMRLPSDWFFIIGKSGKHFILAGRGFGHGLGMSQWGAFCLSNRGWDYKKILKFYYRGVEIKRVYR